jgi:general stress protein 26
MRAAKKRVMSRSENKHEHLQRLLESFDTAFLVTQGELGPHARPLTVAAVEGPTVVWFMTSLESPKVNEIRRDPDVLVTFQEKGRFVVLRGKAELVFDRAKVDRYWTEPQKVWFPLGKEDPSIVLVRVKVDDAELWDQSGVRGLKLALAAAKAYVAGTTPDEVEGRHAEIHPGIGRP